MGSSSSFKSRSLLSFLVVLVILNVLDETTTAYAYSTPNPGSILQNQLDQINRKLEQINDDMRKSTYRLDKLESEGKHQQPHERFERKIDSMEKSIKNLETVNEVWKNNFRAIKKTLSKTRSVNVKPLINF